ncbi:gelsolin-like protein 2 isoform X1 [Ostrea edulis]|nr:gelsolin-like protein 2 isoform X1 [Ostrea edulis]XP_055999977.1 gelsolin-like protein 2 isoform X1 [Ostrea edulis]
MTGLVKAKQYDWKDSNLALFGSDTEKQVKKESAESEPAWKGIGQKPGVQIWRIVKFKVASWPKEDYGKFYNGDSYIVLNTYKEESSDELLYDVHFWIGKYSTQDEYGTAAYKTVELDTFLDDKPIQHREVQGFESDLFKSYFDTITILDGGAESGFNKVTPEKYEARLFHFCGTKKLVEVRQVPRAASRLDSGDVFILDLGLTIYQWNGRGSNKDERMKAMQYLIALKDERRGRAKSEVLEEEGLSKSHEFYHALTEEDVPDEAENMKPKDLTVELFRLSDASGKMTFNVEKTGSVATSDLDSKDVFIVDTKRAVYVWIGLDTSEAERKNAMSYAHKYLQNTDHPLLSVTCLAEGKHDKQIRIALSA